MAIDNVILTDTFAQWVTKSNEVIDKVNDVSDDAINEMEARALVHDWALIANTTGEQIPDEIIPDSITRDSSLPSWIADSSETISENQIPDTITRDSEIRDWALVANATGEQIPENLIPDSIARGGSVPTWVSDSATTIPTSKLPNIPDGKIPSSITRDSELSSYALLSGATFTGPINGVKPPSAENSTVIAPTSWVRDRLNDLIDSAPGTLDTLNEIADALGDDPNFRTTIINLLNAKASLSGATFTGALKAPKPVANSDTTDVATTNWIRDFFADARRREYTTTGNYTYMWEWEANQALLVLEGAGGGSARHIIANGTGGNGSISSINGSSGDSDTGNGGGATTVIIDSITYLARGGGGGGKGDAGKGGIIPASGGRSIILGRYIQRGTGTDINGAEGGAQNGAPESGNRGGSGGGGERIIFLVTGMTKNKSISIQVGNGGSSYSTQTDGGDGSVTLYPIY